MIGDAVIARDVFHLYPTGRGHVAALRGLTLDVAAGERVVIHGPNGSGKTTLMRVLAGDRDPSAGTVRVWKENGTLLCEVQDEGRIEAPLAGRIKPRPDQLTGRGLWLVNQLCDLVQIRSSEQGNVVRLHMSLR